MGIRKVFYGVLLLYSCLCCSSCTPSGPAMPAAANGLLDLRQQSFAQNIPLDGQWEFFWQQLKSPLDSSTKGRNMVMFPFMWNGARLNGKVLPAFGYATYRLTVLLPKNAAPLRIILPDVYCAYRLFINGKQVAENGKVSTTEKGFIPYWEYEVIDLPEHTGTIQLLLQVANFVHSKGGVKKSIVIGRKDSIELDRQRVAAIDLFLTGCLFMGGLFFLGLYLLGNKDKAILLFSLYAMVYSYRIVGIDHYVLHTILPGINWYITARLEYTTLFMGIGLFGLYTRYLYPDDTNKTIIMVISSICFAFTMITLCFAPVYFSRLVNPFLIIMLFCLGYVPYVYTLAYKKKRPGSIYALISSFVSMTIFAISLLHYWGIVSQFQLLNFVCYISFFFLQSLILSHRVSFQLKKARQEAELGLIAKSEFLSTMSHEIRTPLNAVIGMSHLLLKNHPREDQTEQLDVMLFSANNLLTIVNDILDYNKIEAGKISFEHIEMDLISIVRNIVTGLQTVAHDKGIGLKLRIDPLLKNKLLGDPTRVFQVITNLVHNAIKFTQTGYVEVGISVREQTEKNVTLNIRIKDTGIGISEEKQKKIFERFTQADSSTSRSFGGTGLGLAICKRILELQGSSLQLISKEGEGATFYFIQTFEKSIKTLQQQHIENDLPKEEDKPLSGISILLVEDNLMNILVAQKFLQCWGADIDVVSNGLEALDKLDITKHRLILTDLHMPVMDGYESSSKMRALGVTIPIIALTANLPHEIEEKVRVSGIDDIVIKPFLPDELYRKVLRAIFNT